MVEIFACYRTGHLPSDLPGHVSLRDGCTVQVVDESRRLNVQTRNVSVYEMKYFRKKL